MRGATAGVLLIGCVAAAAAGPAPQKAPTIKDLEDQQVEVDTAPPRGVDVDKTMDSYRRFLDLNAGDAALRAEALRRLGDLNLESSESQRIERELVTNEGLRATEAIHLYSALLAAYPNYERNDAVLYQLARAHELNAQPEQALAALDRLVAHYPKSRYFDEAQFRRGELLFALKEYAKAQGAYEAVIQIGAASPFYNQSLYKHGWALFKQGDNERSLDSFARVLDSVLLSKRDPSQLVEVESLSRANRELVEDTLRVMAITFSYGEGPKSIDEFVMRRKPRPYVYLLYSRLGDLYIEKERYTDAADAYRAFVTHDRNNERAPLLEMQAIEAYAKGGFPDLVLQGKREFVENYSYGTPYWQGRSPASEPKVVAELKTNLKDVAQYYHAQAQRSKNPADFEEAAKWYRSYLKSFPDDPDAAATNSLLADTLFENRQYLQAAQEYENTAYHYGHDDKAAAAGYAAIVAFSKEEERATGEQRAKVHALGIDSALRFAQSFPQHPQTPQVLSRLATELYAAKDYVRAQTAAETLLAHQPPVDAAKQRTAWTVIANCDFEQGRFPQAESAYRSTLALMPAGDPERQTITDRLAASVYKQGEEKNKSGDRAGAVEDFLRVAAVAPGSTVRANADFDAAALLIDQQQWSRAITVLEGFRRGFPTSPLQPDVTRKLAVAYAAAGQPGPAAREFEQIAQSPTESAEVQREAVLQAADLYDKAGDGARSRAMLEAFIKRFPQPLDPAMEARSRLAQLAAKSGDLALRDRWLKDIVAADHAAGAARTERSRVLAAKATLALAAPVRDEFMRIKLVAPLKKSLAEKRRAMEGALSAYSHAADYQVAEVTTAATYESAELYRQLGKDLLSSERPRKLSKDELEQYDVLLEEQAFPFEEKAIKLYEVDAARAKEGIYDEWVQKSFAALAQLNPGRYAKTEMGDPAVAVLGAAAPAAATQQLGAAVTQFNAGHDSDAELEFKQMIIDYPQQAAPQFDLGLLYLRSSRLPEAEGAFRAALQAEPHNAAAGSELGISERRLGKFAAARTAYQGAIEADPNYAPAYLNLGVLEDLYLGEPRPALEHFEHYVQLAGESKPVSGWLAELRKRLGVHAPTPPEATPPAAPPTGTAGNAAAAVPAPAPKAAGEEHPP